MNIKVLEIVENEDGSAIIVMDTDNDARQFLMERGIHSLLREFIDERFKQNED